MPCDAKDRPKSSVDRAHRWMLFMITCAESPMRRQSMWTGFMILSVLQVSGSIVFNTPYEVPSTLSIQIWSVADAIVVALKAPNDTVV